MELKVVNAMQQSEFISEHVALNQPCVIRHQDFQANAWTPAALKKIVGDLSVQIYDTLFDLQDIDTLSAYLDKYFGQSGTPGDSVPYVRWYNKLKDVDFAWGDEAFERLSKYWRAHDCLPQSDFLVPFAPEGGNVNPVTDIFPYRGILIAARGARTRLHRDPFCSDAIVNQFYGVKEFALYRPERTMELMETQDGNSFGGFIDIRKTADGRPSIQPDYAGTIGPGEMIYIPHGWLHDVVVVEDSVSITWNFVHGAGAKEFLTYLEKDADHDQEFETLNYLLSLAGKNAASGAEALNNLYRDLAPT